MRRIEKSLWAFLANEISGVANVGCAKIAT
jgi:hypothetical protein